MAMRKTMSKTELARKNAKSKATRDAKKNAALKELGIDVKRTKIRKKRKPMTEEQHAEAIEKLKDLVSTHNFILMLLHYLMSMNCH